jgi:L-cysteine S-thiosulfotransferase
MRSLVALLVSGLLLCACGLNDPKSERGFRLPDGDATAGRQAFIDLSCSTCHRVAGIAPPQHATSVASIALGGATTRVRTYGELVTSIINPSHRIAVVSEPSAVSADGKSLMELAALNERMTVRQLTDLVAFLQTQYKVVPPPYNPYAYRYP